ncbi:hypothetical protein [Thermosinus carboxydivorans]|uniref:hypothetical protein n=1 Tax=Thermosinus carboxydivorans TaxID=261685 RepID=UPI0005949108|nr:hypothetical protein [Thermosinus carboxydivorans]
MKNSKHLRAGGALILAAPFAYKKILAKIRIGIGKLLKKVKISSNTRFARRIPKLSFEVANEN